MRRAVCPGSFDPVTNGHLDIVTRAASLFDEVVVAVGVNMSKNRLFTPDERMAMIAEAVGQNTRLEVCAFDGLLVDYANQRGATCVLRGLRAVSDFEFEFQMAHMNRRLSAGLETVFMMTGEEHFYVSSQMVREVASFGGNVAGLVPPHVEQQLRKKFQP